MNETHDHEHVNYENVKEYLEQLEPIDNKKISYAVSKLSELFEHMHKRNGRPDLLKFPEDGLEGAISVSISFTLPPYAIYKHSDLKVPKIASIGLHASLLHRENKDNPVQWFKTMDGFLAQVDNWYNYEMSLPIPKEN
jgi:hypothetical protein